MALFLAAICAAALSANVTIESQGSSIGQLVKEMGRQAGVEMTADADIESDRVVARMDAVPLEDAKKMLALQDEGKWVQIGSEWKFRRDLDALDRQEKAEREDRVKGWAHKIERLQAKMGVDDFNGPAAQKFAIQYAQLVERRNTGDLDDYVRLSESEYDLPIGRAMVRTLAAVGPEKLAQWPRGYTEFSTNPGSLQQPIGDSASSILEAYKAEEKVWNSVHAPGSHIQGVKTYTPDVDVSEAAAGFIFKLAGHGVGGVGVMIVYDAKGTILSEWVTTLGVDVLEALHKETKQSSTDEKAPDWQTLPHLSRELYRLRDERPRDQEILEMWKKDKTLQEALNHPEGTDIDGLVLGQQVLAMARAKKLNLIIPEITTLARFMAESGFKEDQFNVNLIKTALDFHAMPDAPAGWYLIRKTGEEVAFLEGQGIADPATLGNFFRSTQTEDQVYLEQVAPLYVGSKGLFGLGGNFGIIDRVINALKPDLPGWGWTSNSPMSLSFYGGLSPDQQRTNTGSPIALAALTPENWAPILLDPWMLEGALKIPSLPKGTRSIYSDPFVFFGTTDSRQGNLKITSDSESTVGIDEDGFLNYHDLKDWNERYGNKHRERGNHPPKFRPANRRTVKMTFTFENHAEMVLELHCDDPAGPVVETYDQLPKEYREEFVLPKIGS